MNNKRITINKATPKAFDAMLVLEEFGKTCSIHPILKELIKIRASILNGCAYCLDMHTEDAISLGENARRINAVSVWHESHLFNEEERTVLRITDEVTKIADKGLTDSTYQKAIELFGESATAEIIMLIVTINAWNRIAVSTRLIYKP
ncbi:MAG TPA: carboxymuconolactone decarboxylase family protein [Chitinophagaceae bacterium]|nr:carboxymuconolactone decarboxylase family protein [Chitinophagaceae bacterium]